MRKNLLITVAALSLIIQSNFTHTYANDAVAQQANTKQQVQQSYKNAIKMSVNGLMDRAMNEYVKIIKLDPCFSQAYNNLGYIYRQKGKIDLAIEYYNKAINLNPNDDNTHNNLASCYEAKGDFAGAIREYAKALELDPGSITYELAVEKLLKKHALKEGKDFKELQAHVASMYPSLKPPPSYAEYSDKPTGEKESAKAAREYTEKEPLRLKPAIKESLKALETKDNTKSNIENKNETKVLVAKETAKTKEAAKTAAAPKDAVKTQPVAAKETAKTKEAAKTAAAPKDAVKTQPVAKKETAKTKEAPKTPAVTKEVTKPVKETAKAKEPVKNQPATKETLKSKPEAKKPEKKPVSVLPKQPDKVPAPMAEQQNNKASADTIPNKLEAMLKNPQVGSLMVLYKN